MKPKVGNYPNFEVYDSATHQNIHRTAEEWIENSTIKNIRSYFGGSAEASEDTLTEKEHNSYVFHINEGTVAFCTKKQLEQVESDYELKCLIHAISLSQRNYIASQVVTGLLKQRQVDDLREHMQHNIINDVLRLKAHYGEVGFWEWEKESFLSKSLNMTVPTYNRYKIPISTVFVENEIAKKSILLVRLLYVYTPGHKEYDSVVSEIDPTSENFAEALASMYNSEVINGI